MTQTIKPDTIPFCAITDTMVEAKAIILFYQDEFDNLAWIAECDASGNRAAGALLGRDMDRWENHPAHVQDRFRSRARAALGVAPDRAPGTFARPLRSDAEGDSVRPSSDG